MVEEEEALMVLDPLDDFPLRPPAGKKEELSGIVRISIQCLGLTKIGARQMTRSPKNKNNLTKKLLKDTKDWDSSEQYYDNLN